MVAQLSVQLMKKHRLRRLVIADDAARLVGIVTMEDVLELLVRELADLASALAGPGIGRLTNGVRGACM